MSKSTMSPTNFGASFYCFRVIYIENCWPLKSRSRSQSAFFWNNTFRWQMSKSTNVYHTFCASAYHFRDIKCQICHLQKVVQDHGVLFSQLHHFMTNVKIYECLAHFCASSYRFGDLTILNFWPSKSWTKSWSAIFAITPFDVKCQILQMSLHQLLC